MESIIGGEEWSGTYNEEPDFMAKLLGTYPLLSGNESSSEVFNTFWTEHDIAMTMEVKDMEDNNSSCFSFPCSSSNQGYYTTQCSLPVLSNYDGYSSISALNFCVDNATNFYVDNAHDQNIDKMIISPRPNLPQEENELHDRVANSKKRSRCSDDNVQKKKRNVPRSDKMVEIEKPKKSRKNNVSCNDEIDDGTCCSEEDTTNASSPDGVGSGAVNSSGKTRASRGAATDPQSLYARKRRERINERLRILQNLVPNGTKVDISTMLEEAVEYVKFLQLQIKLLSSDDLWMYSPIAYNGMDIGLDLKIALPKRS